MDLHEKAIRRSRANPGETVRAGRWLYLTVRNWFGVGRPITVRARGENETAEIVGDISEADALRAELSTERLCHALTLALVPRSRRELSFAKQKRLVGRRREQTRNGRASVKLNREQKEEGLRRRIHAFRSSGELTTATAIAQRLCGEGKRISRQRVARILKLLPP